MHGQTALEQWPGADPPGGRLNDTKIITAMDIKTIAAQLPEKIFVRVNKSFIININNIPGVDSYYVYIKEEEIPIGESFKTGFLDKFVISISIRRN